MIHIGDHIDHPLHGRVTVTEIIPRGQGRRCVMAVTDDGAMTVHTVIHDDDQDPGSGTIFLSIRTTHERLLDDDLDDL